MANVCLTDLNFDAFSEPCLEVEDLSADRYPFIAYASQYWGDHVREARFDIDPHIQSAAMWIVNEPHRLGAYIQAAWFTDITGHSGGTFVKVSLLYMYACVLNCLLWFLRFCIIVLVLASMEQHKGKPI